MNYLEQIYEYYMNLKENPLPELYDLPNIKDEEVNKIYNKIADVETSKEKPNLEFGEIYYFLNEENIPIFFMINGKIDDTNLYSVYKVSDFVDFATDNDFIFKLNNLLYMVEIWNEFFLTEEEIEKSLYIGKISDKDLDILEGILDNHIEIPEEKRGIIIIEEGNSIHSKFKEEESNDVNKYKVRIFSIFDKLEEKMEIEILEDMLYKSLEEQKEKIELPEIAYAKEEEEYAERESFAIIKEKNELIIKVTNKDLIGKKGSIIIFEKKIDGIIPEYFKIKLPEKFQKVTIEYIADNIKIKQYE